MDTQHWGRKCDLRWVGGEGGTELAGAVGGRSIWLTKDEAGENRLWVGRGQGQCGADAKRDTVEKVTSHQRCLSQGCRMTWTFRPF